MDSKKLIYQAIGANIRKIRESTRVAQDTFAANVGLDRSHYGKLERGEFNVSLITLMRIARGLGVPTAKLIPKAVDKMEIPVETRVARVPAKSATLKRKVAATKSTG